MKHTDRGERERGEMPRSSRWRTFVKSACDLALPLVMLALFIVMMAL